MSIHTKGLKTVEYDPCNILSNVDIKSYITSKYHLSMTDAAVEAT